VDFGLRCFIAIPNSTAEIGSVGKKSEITDDEEETSDKMR
jgi:hypothetical protein